MCEIGKFKLESQPERGIFLKPKVYAELFETGTNIKFKGVTFFNEELLSS